MNCRYASAAQQSEPNHDHIHHRKNQEQASQHRSHDGSHSKVEDFDVDMSLKSLIHILTVEEIDGELQALSNQGGEEEEVGGHPQLVLMPLLAAQSIQKNHEQMN